MLLDTLKNTAFYIADYWKDNDSLLIRDVPLTKKQCVSLSVAATTTYVLWKLYKRSIRSTVDPSLLPPMVKGALPLYGHLNKLKKDPAKFLDEARDTYGPCFRITVPGQGTVVVATGTVIEEIMKANKNFSFFKGIELVFPSAKVVELSYQHKWEVETISPRAKNPTIYPIKQNFKEHQIDVFTERIMKSFEAGLKKHFDLKKGEREEVDVWPLMGLLVANISCACFAGSQATGNEALIRGMATFTQKIGKASMFWTVLPQWLGQFIIRHFFSVEKEMDYIMGELVPHLTKVRNGELGDDYEETYATMVLNLPKEDGSLRSVPDAAYHFNAIALASIHTTSHFTTFALHELAPRPQLVEDLRAELATLGDNRTPETVAKLSLMDSFFREVLRHNDNYLGLHHLTLKDSTLSTGHVVPKDSVVVLSVDQMHRDLRFLPIDQETGEPVAGETPLSEFDAYRYHNKKVKSTNVGLEFLPFGMGAHACPGRFFAANEIKYMVAEILMRYNVTTKTGLRAKDNVFLGMIRFPPKEPLIFEAI